MKYIGQTTLSSTEASVWILPTPNTPIRSYIRSLCGGESANKTYKLKRSIFMRADYHFRILLSFPSRVLMLSFERKFWPKPVFNHGGYLVLSLNKIGRSKLFASKVKYLYFHLFGYETMNEY